MKGLYTWGGILAITLASVVGDVLLARAMKQVGDVGDLWREHGLLAVIRRTLGNPHFFFGVTAMGAAFFSLLFALSWGDVSLVGPAAASLTYIGNAFAAKIFLHERVDRRRWIAASLVAAGVALLAGENRYLTEPRPGRGDHGLGAPPEVKKPSQDPKTRLQRHMA